MLALLEDGGHWAVAWAEDGVFRKGKNVGLYKAQCGAVGRWGAANGAREQCVSDDGDGNFQPGDEIGCAAS